MATWADVIRRRMQAPVVQEPRGETAVIRTSASTRISVALHRLRDPLLWVEIMSYIDVKSMCAMGASCKAFHIMYDSDVLWSLVEHRAYDEHRLMWNENAVSGGHAALRDTIREVQRNAKRRAAMTVAMLRHDSQRMWDFREMGAATGDVVMICRRMYLCEYYQTEVNARDPASSVVEDSYQRMQFALLRPPISASASVALSVCDNLAVGSIPQVEVEAHPADLRIAHFLDALRDAIVPPAQPLHFRHASYAAIFSYLNRNPVRLLEVSREVARGITWHQWGKRSTSLVQWFEAPSTTDPCTRYFISPEFASGTLIIVDPLAVLVVAPLGDEEQQ